MDIRRALDKMIDTKGLTDKQLRLLWANMNINKYPVMANK